MRLISAILLLFSSVCLNAQDYIQIGNDLFEVSFKQGEKGEHIWYSERLDKLANDVELIKERLDILDTIVDDKITSFVNQKYRLFEDPETAIADITFNSDNTALILYDDDRGEVKAEVGQNGNNGTHYVVINEKKQNLSFNEDFKTGRADSFLLNWIETIEVDEKAQLLSFLSSMSMSAAKRYFKLSKHDEKFNLTSRDVGRIMGVKGYDTLSETKIFSEIEQMGVFEK